MTELNLEWDFPKTNEYGEGDGGNPGEYSVKDTGLKDFVRESLQNANDAINAADDLDSGEVIFRLRTLDGQDLERFKESLNWSTLEEHIQAQEDNRVAHKTKNSLQRIKESNKLRLLTIEDRNAKGLVGSEEDKSSRYGALLRGMLHSSGESGSGGTYGLGKSVYWAFSGIDTALFYSNLSEELEGQESPRFTGKTNLSVHELEEEHRGTGYFGEREDEHESKVGDAWSETAKKAGEKLKTTHNSSKGTSISVIDFSGPKCSYDKDLRTIAEDIRDTALRYFWPSIVKNDLDIEVVCEGEKLSCNLSDLSEIRPFVEMYRKYLNGEIGNQLENEGDTVMEELSVEIPKRDKGHKEIPTEDGSAHLIVRKSNEDDERVGNVAPFRKARMVTDYIDQSSITGSFGFHALLLAGQAVEDIDNEDFETFLSYAEPPKHDTWSGDNSDVDQYYVRGAKQRLKDFKKDWKRKLGGLVTKDIEDGHKGPEDFGKMIPLNRRFNDGGGESKPFHFVEMKDGYENSRYFIDGRMKAEIEKIDGSWKGEISMEKVDEEDNKISEVQIERRDIRHENVESSIEEGVLKIEVDEEVSEIGIKAESEKISEKESTKVIARLSSYGRPEEDRNE